MLIENGAPAVDERLRDLVADVPVGDVLLGAVKAHPRPFKVLLEEHGCAFQPMDDVDGRPNRCAVKVFVIAEGPFTGQCAVFFYKKSRVPFSRDRFSYGVCVTKNPTPEDASVWLDFAVSGFDPDRSPRALRKAFTFTVP
jgi:hypothetical protein